MGGVMDELSLVPRQLAVAKGPKRA
jgi:hypothetical protein